VHRVGTLNRFSNDAAAIAAAPSKEFVVKIALPATVLVMAVLLTGCAGEPSSDTVTLASTKSPAQLLRNEIAGRVPEGIAVGEPTQSDASESCDSDGLARSWRSSVQIAIDSAYAVRLEGITDEIVQSFVDQGWKASTRDGSSRLLEHRLTSTKVPSDVRITADTGDDEGLGASLLIAVTGPCVTTGGADSDEVKQLENRK
jgi:hypothetical protein